MDLVKFLTAAMVVFWEGSEYHLYGYLKFKYINKSVDLLLRERRSTFPRIPSTEVPVILRQ